MNASRIAALAALALPALTADATWSVLMVDTRTGEIAVGSCTCLTGLDLQAITPVLLVGVGAATAQSRGDSTQQNRTFIRDRLGAGVAPADILTALATFDPTPQNRQYGMVDVSGHALTFSGTLNGIWAGGRTGSFPYSYAGHSGSITYAIQGNVLTGEPVVLAAVAAAQNTPGDLPARFMAAMEAARVMGGDGRCSCSPDDATGCGSPPPTFTKSAHIGYMLIARAGDRDGGHGVYRGWPGGSTAVSAADFNSDSKPDFLLAAAGTGTIAYFPNTTPTGLGTPIFGSSTVLTMAGGTRAIATLDVNRDSKLDLASVDFAANSISLRRGNGNGTFAGRVGLTTAAGPQALAVADLDATNGDDLAVAVQSTGAVTIRLNNGTGGFPTPVDVPVGADPRALVAGRLGAAPDNSLVAAVTGANKLAVIQRGTGGTFSVVQDIPTGAPPADVAVARFRASDVNALIIAAAGGASPAILVFSAPYTGTPTAIPLGAAPTSLAAADVTGDGLLDLVITYASTTFSVFRGQTDATFVLDQTVQTGWNVTRVALADLDNDGDLDAMLTVSGTADTEGLIAPNRAGRFDSGIGTAFGDYFMNFNVPNQSATDPDPVLQLRARYDAWRGVLIGKPDAVQSVVDAPTNLYPNVPTSMLVDCRDWRGDAIDTSSVTLTARITSPGDPVFVLGTPARRADGLFRISITPLAVASRPVELTATSSGRSVVLMPKLTLTSHACVADADADGNVTFEDLLYFLFRLDAGDSIADVDNGSGTGSADLAVTIDDLLLFLYHFELGC